MEKEIQAAMEALGAAIPLAQSDPARPLYHFTPPAQWMNDINGTIFFGGYHHIFYQHNPFADSFLGEKVAHMHWGRARSKDLVNWEHLPIALAPSTGKGEKSCWSGCAAVDGEGRPIIFYTAVFEDEMPYRKPFEQWAAIGDQQLITWKKSSDNPVLSLHEHGGPDFSPEWRDPFLFKASGKTFLLLGACGEAGVPVFEAQDASLMRWKYAARLLDANVECPNFFSLNDKWVFISSPFDHVNYSVGTLDVETLRFSPGTGGIVDWGQYYGTNMLTDYRRRCILFGWIPGWDWDVFQFGRGWNGCMSLPRVLSLDSKGRLLQEPVPELQKLRLKEGHVSLQDVQLGEQDRRIEKDISDTCEIRLEISGIENSQWNLRISSIENDNAIHIRLDPQKHALEVAGTSIPLAAGAEGKMRLHLFIDRSVVEIYVNDGEEVVSRMFPSALGNTRIELSSERGSLRLDSLNIWKLDTKGHTFWAGCGTAVGE